MNNNSNVRWVAIISSIFLALFILIITLCLSSAARIAQVELKSEIQNTSLVIQLENMNDRLNDIYQLLEIRIKSPQLGGF